MNNAVLMGVVLALGCNGSTQSTLQPVAAGEGAAPTAAAAAGTMAAAAAAGSGTTPSSTGMSPTTQPSGQTAMTTGAGGTGAAAAATNAGAGGSQMLPEDTGCATCRIPTACQGFPLEGLKYSPGGDTLPSKCRPFNPTTNNPYAVRCIDAMPDYKTPFPGDQYCILPPPPDKGIQVGLHPQGHTDEYWKQIWAGDLSGYDTDDPDWILQAGEERTQNYRSHDAHNDQDMNYYRTYFRMRTGSHHMIVSLHDSTAADGWIAGTGEALPGMFDPSSGTSIGILGGEQRPDDSTPTTLDKPPEDAGLYLVWPANPSIIFNMHHFNTTDGNLLREGWINIWWEDDAQTRINWYMGLDLGQVVGLSVNANEVKDYHYAFAVNSDLRLIRVFGHRHFWTTNFSSWIKRKSGDTELLYQSFDWFDMPTFRYDSLTQNPPLNTDKRLDGAESGIIMLHQGDELHFNCHIEYTDERQATDPKAPRPTGTLRFANEAYGGEMCINFGNVSGGTLGLPTQVNEPPPDFATVGRN